MATIPYVNNTPIIVVNQSSSRRLQYITELKNLTILKRLLDRDPILPLRFDIQRIGDSYDLRRFQMTIRGVEGFIAEPGTASHYKSNLFIVTVDTESYPEKIPKIGFDQPILFHPHVYPINGGFCWGPSKESDPSQTLLYWFSSIVKYIQYDPGRIGDDPANGKADEWWKKNRSRIHEYIRPIDLVRLQHIIRVIEKK
jgi:ubiquitin-protein ligase